jgi:hypothetical protein
MVELLTTDEYLRLGTALCDASHLKNQHKDLLIGDKLNIEYY